jgi:stage V sporulation protein T
MLNKEFIRRTRKMKATGIVRRIDDLGRVVIPREIRRIMRVREGDPLEIFVDNVTGGILLKKYDDSVVGSINSIIDELKQKQDPAFNNAIECLFQAIDEISDAEREEEE